MLEYCSEIVSLTCQHISTMAGFETHIPMEESMCMCMRFLVFPSVDFCLHVCANEY